MSEPIKVGDLVVVVRDCCGHYLGRLFIVEKMTSGNADCVFCGTKFKSITVAADHTIETLHDNGNLGLVSWLLRIPPLWELDETEHKEELPA